MYINVNVRMYIQVCVVGFGSKSDSTENRDRVGYSGAEKRQYEWVPNGFSRSAFDGCICAEDSS